jgi:hypothetical protein
LIKVVRWDGDDASKHDALRMSQASDVVIARDISLCAFNNDRTDGFL